MPFNFAKFNKKKDELISKASQIMYKSIYYGLVPAIVIVGNYLFQINTKNYAFTIFAFRPA